MTVRPVRSIARDFSAVIRMNSDSGVVTRMCGGFRHLLPFWAGVSPVRTAVRIGDGAPISPSGVSRFRWTSFDSAFRGET